MQHVLGILDDPQHDLAIFLQKKAQNALWVILIHSMNATTRCGPFFSFKRPTTHCGNLSEFVKCHNALWAYEHTNNTRTTYKQHFNNTITTYQHTNNTQKTHKQNINLPTTHYKHTNKTPTFQQHTNNMRTTLQQHANNTPTYQ